MSSANSRRPTQMAPDQSRPSLDNKDLVIRMLAEIFQVCQAEDGQIRWQQVSSSLVPISLYSRTTSKWLDYLLSASSLAAASDPASAMSPDSRDFLLLLQQFHHQAKQVTKAQRVNNQQANSGRQRQDSIVFQLIGHDFIDGQCKRILNVKIMQPGTRLGQASDYFIYWKEQPPHWPHWSKRGQHFQMLQQFSSSYASSNSCLPVDGRPSATTSQACCSQRQLAFRTWGLNFASINDAKLFYDICSLNLVDLDFNSDYLKQLVQSDRRHNVVDLSARTMGVSPYSMIINHRRTQQQQQQQQQRRATRTQLEKLSAAKLITRQASTSKCMSCNRASGLDQSDRATGGLVCPIHGHQTGASRARSRSTGRRQPNVSGAEFHESCRRVRSFSTPASPENFCPVHQSRVRSNTNNEELAPEIHHPRCLNYLQSRKLQAEMLKSLKGELTPQKPARGLLRASLTAGSNSDNQNLIMSSEALHSKRSTKSRYMGLHLHNRGHLPDAQCSQDLATNEGDLELKANQLAAFRRQQAQIPKNQSSLMPKRSIGPDSSNSEAFDRLVQRDVRLARARYANSKNMKEFLSLDVGGLQQTAASQQTTIFNERHQKQSKANSATGGRHRSLSTKQDLNRRIHTGGGEPSSLEQKQRSIKRSPLQGEPLQGKLASPGSRHDAVGRENYADMVQQTNGRQASSTNSDDAVRNASTTTEDLPMDPRTRRRMLKLTSDEIISERTEPKSLSTASTVELGKQYKEEEEENNQGPAGSGREEKLEHQARAVSLGPELDSRLRGRGARSDASRRRSLERSMCVDLDTSLPTNSFIKFNSRLSPLAQSANPVAGDSQRRFPTSGALADQLEPGGAAEQVAVATNSDMSGLHQQWTSKLGRSGEKSAPDSCLQPERRRTRTRSSDEFPLCVDRNSATGKRRLRDNEPVASAPPNGGKIFDSCHQLRPDLLPKRMSTFKSAPDIGRLLRQQQQHQHQRCTHDCHLSEVPQGDLENFAGSESVAACNLKHKHHFAKTLPASSALQDLPKRTTTLSSYAVPLCADGGLQEHQIQTRQYHSCPNSLRRKRRLTQMGSGDFDHNNHYAALPTTSLGHHHCLCQHCRDDPRLANFVAQSSRDGLGLPRPQQCLHCTGQALSDTQPRCHECNTILAGYTSQHQSQYLCRQNLSSLMPLHPSNQHHHNHRQYSWTMSGHHLGQSGVIAGYQKDSLPRQTPDCVQPSAPPTMRPYSSQSARSLLQYGLYESECEDDIELRHVEDECPSASKSDCCHDVVNRSVSVCLRPSARPYQGYDQTMARSSLKSRLRSRSQPPRSENNAAHLTKSMENVEKLIKEVQLELNSLKRSPIGTAFVDMRYKDAISNLSQAVPGETQVKVSVSLDLSSSPIGTFQVPAARRKQDSRH